MLRKVPLIKEYRLNKLKTCLKCINKYPFNRDKQKECILNLYPGKSEKSVFRGMVIPSLRSLGLIVGYEGLIRLSANGKLIRESVNMKGDLHKRIIRTVVYEIDKQRFGLLETLLKTKPTSKQQFLSLVSLTISAPNDKQKAERILHWISILEQSELLYIKNGEETSILKQNYKQVLLDADKNKKDVSKFWKYFFKAYFEMGKGMADIVDIADLREKVSLKFLKNKKEILTEKQFDEMLRQIPFATDKYIISLGTPMGAEEKLFEYENKYFRTLGIRILREG